MYQGNSIYVFQPGNIFVKIRFFYIFRKKEILQHFIDKRLRLDKTKLSAIDNTPINFNCFYKRHVFAISVILKQLKMEHQKDVFVVLPHCIVLFPLQIYMPPTYDSKYGGVLNVRMRNINNI